MAKSYKWVRMRKEDYDKIVNHKKRAMEEDLRMISGKQIKIKDTQIFKIAANSTWEIGDSLERNIRKSIVPKKGRLKL